MPRPFYTAPSPQAVRDEVKRIAASQTAWSDDTVALIRNLDEFSDELGEPDPGEPHLPSQDPARVGPGIRGG